MPIGWRVGQSSGSEARNLRPAEDGAAAAMKVVNLNGIDYHVSPELTRRLDDERIAATYRNLNERIGVDRARDGPQPE